jgi:hypothetical protein
VPIDVETLPKVGEPPSEVGAGALMLRLSRNLYDPKRLERLTRLHNWYAGCPELPHVARNAAEAVREFHAHARTNLAALIADAPADRQRVRGVRTSVDGDSTGDAAAWELWKRMRMAVVAADALRLKYRFGESFVLVSPPQEDEPDVPVATAEDPRYVVGEPDPMRPWKLRHGLKIVRDDFQGMDLAYLYRPGRLDVAVHEIPRRRGNTLAPEPTRFDPKSWEWAPELAPKVPDGLMPLVALRNLDGLGEFEPHLDLLRRINFMILQRITVAVFQAFKQRALKGAPSVNSKGEEIDYTDIFSAAPNAIWLLPETAEMWESGEVNLSGILESAAADIRQLAAVTRTPMHMLMPSGENQSAEGAAFAREGLVFKVEDRSARDEGPLAQVMSDAFLWLGDEERALPAKLSVIWAPPQRSSLAERASALAQAATGEVPWRTRMVDIGEWDPIDVDRMETEREDDEIFKQRIALAAAQAAAVANPPAAPDEGQPTASEARRPDPVQEPEPAP